MDLTGSPLQIVLKNLPPFHRFIYVLHTLCQYDIQQISRIFATSPRVIQNALEAEQVNVNKIIASARCTLNTVHTYAAEDFHTDLAEAEIYLNAPISVDAAVEEAVGSLCQPIVQARRKKGNLILGATGIAAAVLVVLLLVLSAGSGSNPDVDLDNANTGSITESTGESTGSTEETAEETTDATEETNDSIAASYYADIAIENYGTVTVALYAEAAPETVENFVSLAQSGFYNGLTFHRIMEGFMMQGGCPEGTGYGGNTDSDGNEINIPGEFSANGFDNPLSHTAGAISMARADDYDSGSSQFFIVHTDDYVDVLDGYYACFGYVTDGMDIVDAICTAAEPTDGNGSIAAEDQPVITSITIREAEETEAVE